MHNINIDIEYFVKHNGIIKNYRTITSKKNDARFGVKLYNSNNQLIMQDENSMNSWLFNWCKFLYYSMTSETQTFYLTSGDSSTQFPYYWNISLIDSANSNHGIHAGADDGTLVPLSANNYVLGDRFLEGSTSGKFNYDATVVYPAEEDGLKYKLRLGRYINNYSSDTNVIKELSVVGIGEDGSYITYIRDLFDDFGNPISYSVGQNEALLIYYDLYIINDSGFTINFIKWLEAIIKADSSVSVKSLSNVDINAASSNLIYDMINCYVGAGEDNYGIVIGNGEGETDYNDYSLSSIISHGNGSNQLDYGPTLLVEPAHQSGQEQFKLYRTFTNNSGNTITTKEIGLYGKGTGAGNRVCISRVDLVGVPLDPGDEVEIIYTIRTLI